MEESTEAETYHDLTPNVFRTATEDGAEKPVAYASRTLNPVEKRYSQLDKEALAIVFGVKRFHQYLFGRQFSIVSDHKPLQYLLSENKAVPVMAKNLLECKDGSDPEFIPVYLSS